MDVGKIGVLVTSGIDGGNVLEGSGEMLLQAQTSITIKTSDILILKKYFIFPPKTSSEQKPTMNLKTGIVKLQGIALSICSVD